MSEKRKRPAPPRRRFLIIFLLLLAIAAFAVIGTGAGFLVSTIRTLPSITDFQFRPAQSSFIYDINGELVTKVPSPENRILVSIDEVPEIVKEAAVAIEDERFRQHIGVDVMGIARALWNDIRGGHLQGASTITQQLVRNTIPLVDDDLDSNMEVSLTRKIREALLAIELERRFSKDEILEMYLNQINFGHNARGIEAASRLYFGKSVKDITAPEEAALLVGLPQAPNDLSPYINKEAAKRRRDTVLAKMAELEVITEEEKVKAQERPIVTAGLQQGLEDYPYPYYVDFILQQLIDELGMERLQTGGLKIYTTLDPKVQKAIEDGITTLDESFPLREDDESLQAAMVIIQPDTGYILGLSGGRKHDQVLGLNRAWHRVGDSSVANLQQPGSAIKPITVYSTALANGYTPASVIDDVPEIYRSGGTGRHVIQNVDFTYRGLTTLREAVRRSVNVVSAKLVDQIGPEKAWENARALGITTLTDADRDFAPLAVGGFTRGVSVLDMASAYSVFANQGTRNEPISILRVEDPDGSVIFKQEAKRTRVLDPGPAFLMTDILRSNVEPQSGGWNLNSSTGGPAAIPGWQVAGKTGTTDQTRDVWFGGYTTKMAAAIWIGFDDNRPMGNLGISSSLPARVFGTVMKAAHEGLEPVPFPRPDNIVQRRISIKSGKLAGPLTPAEFTRNELFIQGTEPTELDDAFEEVEVVQTPEGNYQRWQRGCYGQPEEKVFLIRPMIFSDSMKDVALAAGRGESYAIRMVPEDMRLVAPIATCDPGDGLFPPWEFPWDDDDDDDRRDNGRGNGRGDNAPEEPLGTVNLELEADGGRFDPVLFRVALGAEVSLTITNSGDDEHEIRIDDRKLTQTVKETIAPGESKTVTFYPRGTGTVDIRCDTHPNSLARILVERR